MKNSAPMEQEVITTLHLDSPFYLIVRDKKSNIDLFCVLVNNL